MSDRRLAILVEVEGNAKAVFKEIGVAAKQSAQEVTQSGQRAQQGIERIEKAADGAEKQVAELEVAQKKAAKAADEMAQHSEKAGRSLDRYRDSVKQASAGMALLGTAFTMYSNQQRDHEITLNALQRIYGETADSYVAFADQIQNTTVFSNDEALKAAQIFGTLKLNYEMTDAQIQQLIQTSADLATMSGITLTDAATRVQSAIRGEAEAAELLGWTLNQSAIDAEGLTLTMSNAEAAQFRFTAAMEQSTFAMGAAADAAASDTGRIQQYANEFQDAALAAVAFTGPVGQAAAGLTSFGAEAGLAVTGLAALAPVAGKAITAVRGLSMASLGPAGLVLGLGGAAVAAWQLLDVIGPSGYGGLSSALDVAEENVGDLGEQVTRLTATLLDARLALQLFEGQNRFAGMISDLTELNQLWRLYGNPDTYNYDAQPMVTLDENGVQVAVERTTAMIEEEAAALERLRGLLGQYGDSADAALAQVEAAMADYEVIIGHHGKGAEDALREAAAAFEMFENSAKTPQDLFTLMTSLDAIANNLGYYDQAALEAAAATNELTTATHAAAEAYTALELARGNTVVKTQAEIELIEKRLRMYHVTQTAMDAEAMALLGLDMSVNQVAKDYADLFPVIDQTTRSAEDAAGAFSQLTADMKATDIARVTAEYEAAMLAATGLGEALYGLRARGGSVSVDLAINTGGARDALQSGYGAVVGGAEGMGRLADQTAEWAASLTEGNIGQSKLDDLLLKGAISQTTYRRALEANHRIQIANQSVQEDVLRIQAKQLPAMAELAESHARYVDSLADASVQEQAAALGFMDQSKSAQAVAIANMNASAAMAGMSEQAGKMTIAMAEADPYLRAMLLEMEVIEEGADGEITMNTDDAVSATDVLSALNTTLGDLKTLIAQIFLVQVDIEDNASGSLSYIDGLLSQLDGKTANVYINTLGGNTIGFTPGAATGTHIFPESARNLVAKVDAMATGGHIDDLVNGSGRLTLVGEAGAELVSLPTGSTVTNAAGTRGRLDPMGRASKSQRYGGGVTVINNGTVHQVLEIRADQAQTRSERLMRNRR